MEEKGTPWKEREHADGRFTSLLQPTSHTLAQIQEHLQQHEDLLSELSTYQKIQDENANRITKIQSEYQCHVELIRVWSTLPSSLHAYISHKVPSLLACLRELKATVEQIRNEPPSMKSLLFGTHKLLREEGEDLKMLLLATSHLPRDEVIQITEHSSPAREPLPQPVSAFEQLLSQQSVEEDVENGNTTVETLPPDDVPEEALELVDLTVPQVMALFQRFDFSSSFMDWIEEKQITGAILANIQQPSDLLERGCTLPTIQLRKLLSKIKLWKDCAIVIDTAAPSTTSESDSQTASSKCTKNAEKDENRFVQFLVTLPMLSAKEVLEGLALLLQELLEQSDEKLLVELMEAGLLNHLLRYLDEKQDFVDLPACNYILRIINVCCTVYRTYQTSKDFQALLSQLHQVKGEEIIINAMVLYKKNHSAIRSVIGICLDCASCQEAIVKTIFSSFASLNLIQYVDQFFDGCQEDVECNSLCIKLFTKFSMLVDSTANFVKIGLIGKVLDRAFHHSQHSELIHLTTALLCSIGKQAGVYAYERVGATLANQVQVTLLDYLKMIPHEAIIANIIVSSLVSLYEQDVDDWNKRYENAFLHIKGSKILLEVFNQHIQQSTTIYQILFIFTLCSKSNQLQEMLGRHGACSSLVLGLRHHYQQIKMVNVICKVLGRLASTYENTALIAEANGADILLQILEHYKAEKAIVLEIAIVLKYLVINVDIAIQVVNYAGQVLVFTCLQQYQQDGEPVLTLLEVITQLGRVHSSQVLQDHEGKHTTALHLLMQLFYGNNVLIQIEICKIIAATLTEDYMVKTFLQPPSKVAEKLVDLLDSQLKHVESLEEICFAIWTLTVSYRKPFYSLVTCKRLVRCLQTYPENAILMEAIGGCLTGLALEDYGLKQIEDSQGLAHILHGISIHVGEIDVIKQLTSILQLLPYSEGILKQYEKYTQSSSVLIQALKEHQGQLMIAKNICHFIKRVAQKEGNRLKLAEGGLFDFVLEIMSFHVENIPLVTEMCGILRMLCQTNEIAEKFRKRKGLDRVIALVKRGREHAPLALEICSTIWDSCSGYNDKLYLGYGGVFGHIVTLLDVHRHDEQIVTKAVSAMSMLVSDCPNNLRLIQETATSDLLQELMCLYEHNSYLTSQIVIFLTQITNTQHQVTQPTPKRSRFN